MSSQSTTIILIASDLLLTSSVSGAASAAGVPFYSADSVRQAVDLLNAHPQSVLLVDLGTPGLTVAQLTEAVATEVLKKSVAYGPHVHTAKLQAAENAGFGQVLSRGQFSAQVSRIISDAVSASI